MRVLLIIMTMLFALQPLSAAEITPLKSSLEALSKTSQIPYAELSKAVSQAKFSPQIIKLINTPHEGKPWFQYKKLFLSTKRVQEGVKFWHRHAASLKRAEQRYQVPASMIVAILGIETYYGKWMGRHSVLDALYTLGFHYPRRSEFFQTEFANFVRLASQEKWQLNAVKGSYTGAMGMGQFMPSSYLNFAVDFSGNGKRELFDNADDAIGSIANYFRQYQWHYGEGIAYRATIGKLNPALWLNDNPMPLANWESLSKAGAQLQTKLPADTAVKLLELEGKKKPEYWVTLHNFYVLTRYNRSFLYAMAAFELSEQINKEYHATL